MSTPPLIDASASQSATVKRLPRSVFNLILLVCVLVLSWQIAFNGLVPHGSDLAYYLGVAGGSMMLSLLLYPLRKRFKLLSGLGRMDKWFRVHMLLGIGGPLLILFHSSFRIGSMNGRVALYSMILVATSGVVGRFVYRRIHKGLYGKELSLAEVQKELQGRFEDVESEFMLIPALEQKLMTFQEHAFYSGGSWPARILRFISLDYIAFKEAREIRSVVKKALREEGKRQRWSNEELTLRYTTCKRLVEAYLRATVVAAQFTGWEKIFSLWHVIHIPFLYLLILSGLAHVVAVHLY